MRVPAPSKTYTTSPRRSRFPHLSVIVHAPQGSGKSLRAEELRKGFGLNYIVDPWEDHEPTMKPFGCLYLVSSIDRIPRPYRLNQRIFALDDALDMIRRGER